MTEAWFCPACQKHHAPHVETCPGGGVAPYQPGKFTMPLIPGPYDFATTKPQCPKCGIIFDGPMGYVCPRADCPSGVTCGTTLVSTATGLRQ